VKPNVASMKIKSFARYFAADSICQNDTRLSLWLCRLYRLIM